MADAPVSSVVNPAPVPIKNSFSGMMLVFPNVGVHTLIARVFNFRKQITVRSEMKMQSGWNNEFNVFLAQGLNAVDKHCRRIVYNSASIEMSQVLNSGAATPKAGTANQPSGVSGDTTVQHAIAPIGNTGNAMTQTQIEDAAANPLLDLKSQFSDNATDIDNVLAASDGNRQITTVLDGSNLDMPQVDSINCPNDMLRGFIEGLDRFAVQATRLDSRNDPNVITKYENAMLHGLLSQLWTQLENFGGENNRLDIPNGTLPNDEPNTFMGGAQTIGPAVNKTTGA